MTEKDVKMIWLLETEQQYWVLKLVKTNVSASKHTQRLIQSSPVLSYIFHADTGTSLLQFLPSAQAGSLISGIYL